MAVHLDGPVRRLEESLALASRVRPGGVSRRVLDLCSLGACFVIVNAVSFLEALRRGARLVVLPDYSHPDDVEAAPATSTRGSLRRQGYGLKVSARKLCYKQ